MKANEKGAIVKLVGGLGFIFLLVGVFTDWYDTKYWRTHYVPLLATSRCASKVLGT